MLGRLDRKVNPEIIHCGKTQKRPGRKKKKKYYEIFIVFLVHLFISEAEREERSLFPEVQ